MNPSRLPKYLAMPIHHGARAALRDREPAVAVRVAPLQRFGERRRRVVAVAEAHHGVAGDDRAGDHGRRHARVGPQPGAALDRVAAEQAAAGRDDLRRLSLRRVEGRRRPGVPLLPRHLPLHRARRQRQRDDLGPFELVEHQDQRRPGDDRRRHRAHAVGERAHRLLPADGAGRVVGDDAEVAEEDVDVLAVGDGRCCGRLAQDVRDFMPRRRFLALPQQPSRGAIEALGVERALIVGGQEDVSRAQHRRRLAGPDGGAPLQVAVGAELGRIAGVRHDARAVGPAESRPVLRVCGRGRACRKQCDHDEGREDPRPLGVRHGRLRSGDVTCGKRTS